MRGQGGAIDQAATLKVLTRLGVLAIVLICGTVLAGWILGIPALASIVPDWPRMAIIVLICFLLCAGALFELTLPEKSRYSGRARMAAATLVLLVGVDALVGILAGSLNGSAPSSIAGALFGTTLGRPSVASAFDFLLAATALMLPRDDAWGKFYSVLLAAGLAVTGLDFVGYAYGIAALSRGPTLSAMSLPTMSCFILLFTSALLARPQAGWTAIFFSRNSGGIAARRLFPAVLVLPFIVNGIVVLTYRSRPFEALFGFAILAVIMSLGLGIITITISSWLSAYENERRRSQDLLEAIVENSGAIIYVKDLAGRYLMVSRSCLDIFHVGRDVVIGKTDHEFFSKYEADAFRAMDEQVARAGEPLMGEEIASLHDGLHTYVSMKAPLRDEAGNAYAIVGISTDITERIRGEKALAASEERTRLIVETALDAVISIDGRGVINGWNPQAEKIFGWTAEEALGRPIDETIMPEYQRHAHKRGLARHIATGESRILNRRLELTALDRQKREFPVELSITPTRSGDSSGYTAFLRDITERKSAELRVQTQIERMALLERITRAVGQRQDMASIFQVLVRTLEERLPADFVCTCAYDADKDTLVVNHVGAHSRALGRALGLVEGATVAVDQNGLSRCVRGALVYEPDIAEVDFAFPSLLARQGLRSLVFTPLAIEDRVLGVLVAARTQASSFNSTDCEFLKQLGEHVALAANQAGLRDSLEAAYNDLKQTQAAVLQQERLGALGQMASGIAHDINNAISPVALYTKSLLEREPGLSSHMRDYLEIVRRVINDVSATVGRMRDFYRRDDADTELLPVNLNDLVRHVVELTRARWSDMPQQRGIVITVATELEPGLPPVMGNAAELREAMTNLIFNAVDAMPQGGTITIRTASAGANGSQASRVLLEVGDSGLGMDEKTRRRCLEPFFTTKGERGTGLGLAMVYGAVQRHKASLDIASAPGKGTRMRLEFAAVEAQGALEPAPRLIEIPPLRLLLVDDDPSVLHSTQIVLELDGHAIVAADGGQAGIDALKAAKGAGEAFDMMVTDLGMPYVDGNQVARAAKELFPQMTVILLTGWGRKMNDREQSQDHIDHILPKPLDIDELRALFARRAAQ
ncbi:MAG TPA: PAS domain S-box protein [Rhizomicrobium sp.]|jgi:PAS domain S-box-containing protein